MTTPIYLDHNATTPVAPSVTDVITAALREAWGNPSSGHVFGRRAKAAVDTARGQVAQLVNAKPDEIVFTSGGTESNNHALRSVLRHNPRRKLVISAIEHPAIANVASFLVREHGATLTVLPVDRDGVVDLTAAEKLIDEDTALVSVMHSNNEVGSLQPIAELTAVAHARGALMHTDAAQSVGKVRVDVEALQVDLLSIAGHKFYAPKGVGALYVRRGVDLPPLLLGAGHESGRRPGTENVPYMAGLGEAARLVTRQLDADAQRMAKLRNRFEEGLRRVYPKVILNGSREYRLPNTAHVSFAGLSGAALLAATPEIAASTGAACKAGSDEPSGVLAAMGADTENAVGAVRFSLGRDTTESVVTEALKFIAMGIARLAE